jgi:ATP-binding cassette subfamily A (ABC1) protein 3
LIGANIINNAILKQVMNNNAAYIKVRYEGLKLTNQLKNFENTADGFVAVFLFALAYAFIPAGVVLYIVKEREQNAKHQQIVSGVSVSAYWLSNLLIDVLKYLIPGIYCGICIKLFNVNAFLERNALSMAWALIISYGPAVMTFTYATSFLFNNAESAQIATFVFNFLAGFILMIASFVMRAIRSTRDTAPYFPELLLRIFPTYDFAWGLFEVANPQIWQIFYQLDALPSAWSRWGGLIDFIYLLILPFVCMGIVFYVELHSSSVDQSPASQSILDLSAGDEDVKKERAEVMANDDYSIKVVDFAKQYTMISKQGGICSGKMLTTKTAVKGVTFGVKKGECFGLLGTNGAGKTTTFKALSGEIIPSYGVTKIAGYDLTKDMNKVRYLIGYCPQFDALLDNLTAREHLELFASIKGIPYNMREKLIQEKLVQLNLKNFENVEAGTYSGGNKRKLSVAIALLGNPPIILLDEPSSGMDPEARRFMWSVVGKISTEKKHSSVVLTTHSMEEAEALSTKLAIMVEGSIECIGPVQTLKSKYGKGFEVEVKIDVPTKEEVAQIQHDMGLRPPANFGRQGCALPS